MSAEKTTTIDLEAMMDFIVLELNSAGDDYETVNNWWTCPPCTCSRFSSRGREFLTARGVIWSGSYAGFRHGTVPRTRVDEIENDATERHNMVVGFAWGDYDGDYLVINEFAPPRETALD